MQVQVQAQALRPAVGAVAVEAAAAAAVETVVETVVEVAVEVAACHMHQEARSLGLWIRVELQQPCCLVFASLAPSVVDSPHI